MGVKNKTEPRKKHDKMLCRTLALFCLAARGKDFSNFLYSLDFLVLFYQEKRTIIKFSNKTFIINALNVYNGYLISNYFLISLPFLLMHVPAHPVQRW